MKIKFSNWKGLNFNTRLFCVVNLESDGTVTNNLEKPDSNPKFLVAGWYSGEGPIAILVDNELEHYILMKKAMGNRQYSHLKFKGVIKTPLCLQSAQCIDYEHKVLNSSDRMQIEFALEEYRLRVDTNDFQTESFPRDHIKVVDISTVINYICAI